MAVQSHIFFKKITLQFNQILKLLLKTVQFALCHFFQPEALCLQTKPNEELIYYQISHLIEIELFEL